MSHSGTSYLGQAWEAKQEEARARASGSVLLNRWQLMHPLSLLFRFIWRLQWCPPLQVDSGDMVSCNCRCVAMRGQHANARDDYYYEQALASTAAFSLGAARHTPLYEMLVSLQSAALRRFFRGARLRDRMTVCVQES